MNNAIFICRYAQQHDLLPTFMIEEENSSGLGIKR